MTTQQFDILKKGIYLGLILLGGLGVMYLSTGGNFFASNIVGNESQTPTTIGEALSESQGGQGGLGSAFTTSSSSETAVEEDAFAPTTVSTDSPFASPVGESLPAPTAAPTPTAVSSTGSSLSSANPFGVEPISLGIPTYSAAPAEGFQENALGALPQDEPTSLTETETASSTTIVETTNYDDYDIPELLPLHSAATEEQSFADLSSSPVYLAETSTFEQSASSSTTPPNTPESGAGSALVVLLSLLIGGYLVQRKNNPLLSSHKWK